MLGQLLLRLARWIGRTLQAVYFLVSRSAQFVAAAYLVVYFLANSGYVRPLLDEACSAGVPGRIEAKSYHWGPFPWEAKAVDVTIRLPDGAPAIDVSWLEAELDLGGLLGWAARSLLVGAKPIRLHIERAQLHGFLVRMRIDDQGELDLVRAFVPPDVEEPEPEPAEEDSAESVRVRVSGINLEDGRVLLLSPEGALDLNVDHIDGELEVADGFYAVIPRVAISGGHVVRYGRSGSDSATESRSLTLGSLSVAGFHWEGEGFEVERFQGMIAGGEIDLAGRLELGARPGLRAQGRVDLDDLAALGELLGVPLQGQLSAFAEAAGAFDDFEARAAIEAPELALGSFRTTQVGAGVRVRRAADESGTHALAFTIDELTARLLDGQVSVHDGRYVSRAEAIPPVGPETALPAHDVLTAHVAFDRVSLPALLTMAESEPAPIIGESGVTGAITLSGGRFGGAEGDVWQAQAAIDLLLHRDGGAAVPERRLSGRVAFAEGRVNGDPEAADAPPGPVLSTTGLRLRSQGADLTTVGLVGFDPPELRLRVRGSVERLGELLTGLGFQLQPRLEGRVELETVSIRGAFSAPTIQGLVRARALTLGGQAVGRLDTRAELRNGRLELRGLQASGPWGKLDGRIGLQLWRSHEGRALPPLTFHVSRLDADGLDLRLLSDLLPSSAQPDTALAGIASFRLAGLTGRLDRLLASVRGRGTFEVRRLRIGSEGFRHVSGRLVADAGGVGLEDVEIKLTSRYRLEGSVKLDRRGERLWAEARADPMPLSALLDQAPSKLPAFARVGFQVHAEGRIANPQLSGTVTIRDARLTTSDARGKPLLLGDATLELERPPGGDVRIGSPSFFRGMTLGAGSRLTLAGLQPRRMVLELGLHKVDIAPALRALDGAEMGVEVTGDTRISVQLGPSAPGSLWSVEVELPTDGLQIQLDRERLKFANAEPLRLHVNQSGLRTPALVLYGSYSTVLRVCGSLDWNGAADVAVAGDVAGELLRTPLRNVFSRIDGRFRIFGHSTELPRTCDVAALGDIGGALLLSGATSAPVLDGVVEIRSLQAQPRSLGRQLRFDRPVRLTLGPSPLGGGRHRIAIDDEAPIEGHLDDGTFVVRGSLDLRGLHPTHGEMRLVGTDVSYNAAKTFQATFNPELTWTARDLDDPARRASRLEGTVSITEGRYYRSFDRFSQALGGALGREQDAPTQSLSRAVPALADTALDVRVRGSNVAITSSFPFGSTDLELRIDVLVRGTLAKPLVYDRIYVLPGGIVTYNIVRREFEVQRGVLDFDGDPSKFRLDLEARTEIEYIEGSAAGTSDLDISPLLDEERVVGVTVRVKGEAPVFDVSLSSDSRGYDQTDLQYLVLTGAPASSQGEGRTDRSIALPIGAELADVARRLLLSAFVDSVTLGITPEGGIDWGLIASLGRSLKLRTRVVQEGTDKRYRARFEFRITERLSLEGQLKVNEDDGESLRTYESKLRYRIPLD